MTRTIREFVSFPVTLREGTMVRSEGFDDHVGLVFPKPGGSAPELPGQVPGALSWTYEAIERSRNYTVRSWGEGSAEMTIDVERHVGGLAAEWCFGTGTSSPGTRPHCRRSLGGSRRRRPGPAPRSSWS